MEYGCTIIKKGKKRVKIDEYNKTKNLIILALDSSGSMSGGERYVDDVLGNIINEIKDVANEYKVKVNLENLKGCTHDWNPSDIVSIDSNEWRRKMMTFNAFGGNNFSLLYEKCVAYKKEHGYDNLIIINLGDGMDVVQVANKEKDVRWIDAIFTNVEYKSQYDGYVKDSNISREAIFLG